MPTENQPPGRSQAPSRLAVGLGLVTSFAVVGAFGLGVPNLALTVVTLAVVAVIAAVSTHDALRRAHRRLPRRTRVKVLGTLPGRGAPVAVDAPRAGQVIRVDRSDAA